MNMLRLTFEAPPDLAALGHSFNKFLSESSLSTQTNRQVLKHWSLITATECQVLVIQRIC